VDHTFRNYQRGWRMTLVALMASCVTAAFFIAHVVGFTISDIIVLWSPFAR
jgi:hypothetical protein